MSYVNIENVTSTILDESYYEALATTELDTKKIDGETVVTELVDVFIVTTAQIKVDELREIIDSRLIKQQDFAIRLHALSLALNKNTTNKQLYDALVQYDCHPAFVSVVIEIGKKALLDTVEILKICRDENDCEELIYDEALCEAAARNKLEVMEILKEFGATMYTWAFFKAAEGGHVNAMKLLKSWGASNYNCAFLTDDGEDMSLIKLWGAPNYDLALSSARLGGHAEALNLIETWGRGSVEIT
jgi:hypothetical protein